MTNKCSYFSASVISFKDIINLCWNIIETHFLKVKFPKLPLIFGVFDMLLRKTVASIVSHPDIIALSRQHESWRLVIGVGDPLK